MILHKNKIQMSFTTQVFSLIRELGKSPIQYIIFIIRFISIRFENWGYSHIKYQFLVQMLLFNIILFNKYAYCLRFVYEFQNIKNCSILYLLFSFNSILTMTKKININLFRNLIIETLLSNIYYIQKILFYFIK